MASQVKSQLSDKIYDTTLDDLLETDQGLEVDLYKINIFNKDIHIAPGKVMRDAKKDIYYCFVYAIKGGRVAAKIGVYETKDSRGEVYDLSDFDEGSLLLLDYYIQEPTALVEFQIQEKEQYDDSDNIFEYLKQYIKPVTNEAVTMKTQSTIIRNITMRLSRIFPDGNQLLDILKLFRLKRPYDEEFMDSLKSQKPDSWMFILVVLELILNVKFQFNLDGADELRKLVTDKKNTSTELIVVHLEETPKFVNKIVSEEPELVVEDFEEPLIKPKTKVKTQPRSSVDEGELPPIIQPRDRDDSTKQILVPTTVPESKPLNENLYSQIPIKPVEELIPVEPLEPEPLSVAQPKRTVQRSSSETKAAAKAAKAAEQAQAEQAQEKPKIKRSSKTIPKPISKNNS